MTPFLAVWCAQPTDVRLTATHWVVVSPRQMLGGETEAAVHAQVPGATGCLHWLVRDGVPVDVTDDDARA